MPWKVIYFLFIILVFALFAGFNMNNTCHISLFFYTIKDVPVYVVNLFSFLIGIVLTIPFFLDNKKKNPKTAKQGQGFSSAATDSEISGIKDVNLKKQNKFRFWNKKKTGGRSGEAPSNAE